MEPRMKIDERKLLFRDETRQIIGCAMEVLNTLGHGLLEKPYENALVIEFALRGVTYQQQPRFNVRIWLFLIRLFLIQKLSRKFQSMK